MDPRVDIKLLSLSGLSHRCSQESSRFFSRQAHDPLYCYELFRRAILYSNERAWDLIYKQYKPLVTSWIGRHSWFNSLEEETQYFVNGAFEKMWRGIPVQKFERFPDLKSLLRYLQLCVHSVITDYVRREERNALEITARIENAPEVIEPGVEKTLASQLERAQLWSWVQSQLKDEKEERVIYSVYVLGKKPREVFRDHKSEFNDIKEIYRIKERVLNRLRRNNDNMDFSI